MFYCRACAVQNDWPESIATSYGRCENCASRALCYDTPSYLLPTHEDPVSHMYLTQGQIAQNEELEAIRSIKRTIKERS